ncbi:acyl-CoA N-acyltransferase [Aspergillus insuetus]
MPAFICVKMQRYKYPTLPFSQHQSLHTAHSPPLKTSRVPDTYPHLPHLINCTTMTSPYTLRDARPSDMPRIVQRHKDLYSTEYNYNMHFVSIVSQVTTDFIANHDPAHERCWIAERDGQFLGCIMLVKDKSTEQLSSSDPSQQADPTYKTAKLRLLLVEPSARGLGLGRDLVTQCTRFAREAGYERIRLWTNSELVSARRLYMREGYRLVRAEEDESLGVKIVAEYWELEL